MFGFKAAKMGIAACVDNTLIKGIRAGLEKGSITASTYRVALGGLLLICLVSCRSTAAPAVAGSIVTLPVSLSTGTQPISAVQFDFDLPVGVSSESVTAGSAAIAANKQVSTAMFGNDIRIIISGVNQTPIPSGPLALVSVRLAPSLPTGSFQMTLTNVVASDPSGFNVQLSTSVPGVLSVIANVMPFLKVGSN